ncbi:MAG: radical SAM protein, partial [Elusimicrobia bacterium]|nr:radical SAM protein [Elusimicrobiota bacterium]
GRLRGAAPAGGGGGLMAELAYLQVARVCNQKCLFCSNPENGRIISWSEAAALVDSFADGGAAGVILTGGEPTLFDRLPELVAYARRRGLAPRLITNGQRTSDPGYLRQLASAGLEHLHASIHSVKPEVQGELTGNPRSLPRLLRTLENAEREGLRVDVNTVINSRNADHLGLNVRFLAERFPFLGHFVWNCLDPLLNRASLNPGLVPRLRAFETELHDAMTWLDRSGRTFRVERVPLCYMSDFAHRSTETRKIVKEEGREIYFLDEKGRRRQDRAAWSYGKSARCRDCSLDGLCAGLYQMGTYYSEDELCPVFASPEDVAARVREDEE